MSFSSIVPLLAGFYLLYHSISFRVLSGSPNGTAENAQSLWTDLLAMVRRENEAGGYLDREKLLNALRGKYHLKPFPDYTQDWQRLVSWGEEIVDALPDTIGGKVRLPRSELVNEVMESLISRKMCAVIGSSGTGKSVVSKLVSHALGQEIPVLRFDAEEFASDVLDQLPTRLQLQHRLSELLAYLPTRSGVVVLDGLERLTSDAGYVQVKRLLTAIRAGQQTSPWLVLLSCQIDRWEDVQTRLIRIGVDPSALAVIQMPPLAPQEFQAIYQTFPNLSFVFFRPHLSEILQRPKVLDILAAHAESMKAEAPTRWAGESDLVNWYWESVVSAPDDGPARSIFLQRLGEWQAGRGGTETPLVDLTALDTAVLRNLARDGVCHVNRAQRILFNHDLIGDWCRQRVLLARESVLDHYIRDRIENPYWHRAMRLYGLHLIESEEGIQRWLQAREQLPFFSDLLLDAVVLAANSYALLEKLWAILQAQNGLLLRRLLTRFLHVATYPHPMAVWIEEHAKQPIGGWLRANLRQPLATYWLGMLQFLHSHITDVVGLASLEIAKVVAMWLRLPGKQWPFRKEAAELGLAVGEATLRARLLDLPLNSENDEKKYDAALAAASELPAEVADFALRACARKLLPEVESGAIGDYVRPGALKRIYSTRGLWSPHAYERPVPEPWPDGPKYRVDEAFQKVCLFEGGLASLMTVRPDVAREVILAALIREPQPADPTNKLRLMTLHEEVALDHLPQFSPALSDKGPFWLFLGIAPQEALDCILHLVNFATVRWVDHVTQGNGEPPSVMLLMDDGERHYLGSFQVCGWYRGAGASDIVASALMALEDWLYSQLRDGQPIEDVIHKILHHGNSCAFLGLLWEVGRFKPALFTTSLRPLLTCAELYQWESHALPQGLHQFGLFGLIGIHGESAQTQKRIRDWEGMAHRAILVRDLALRLFLFEPAMEDFFTAAQMRWRVQRDQLPPAHPLRDYLEALIPQFNKENWHASEVQPGKTGFQYVLPPSLHARAEKANEAIPHAFPFILPLQCRSILRGEDALAPASLDSFLATLQGLLQDKTTVPQEEFIQRMTAVCAGIAVLAKRHWDWLIDSDERMFWCKTTLLTILREPPESDKVGAEYERHFLSWEDFAAQAIIPFWAHAPLDRELREAITMRVMAHRYSAVRLLTHTAFDFRSQLGEEFDRLITLVLHWAVIRHDRQRMQYRKDQEVNMTVEFDEHRHAFVDGTISTDWGEWGKRAIHEGEKYSVRARRSRGAFDNIFSAFGVHPRIDLTLIGSAFSFILLPGQAHSSTERRKWLQFWEETLACILGTQRFIDEAGSPVFSPNVEASHVYESDRWFADTLAEVILHMKPEEEPARLWKPIVDLGPPAHQWIEMFFSTWLVHGLRSTKQKRFIAEWQAMFAHALQSPIWSDREKCWPHWDDFWLDLLGLDHWDTRNWQEEHVTIVEQMAECYAQWLPHNLHDRQCARAFLYWLRRPAAQPMRLRAIPWLLSAARSASNYWWDGKERAEQMAEIVDVCWREQRTTLLADQALLKDFRALVSLLAQRQNALAMDLQERMGGYRG